MGYGRIAAVALAALLFLNMVSQNVSAMPVNGLASAAKRVTLGLQDVRGPCGIYRCPRPHWLRYCWYGRWQTCPPYWDWHRRWW